MTKLEIYDHRALALVPADAVLEVLATGCAWSERPVWMQEDGSVLWSDISKNRMMRWHPDGGGRVWRQPADFVNGHTREAGGSLLHCSHGRRAVRDTKQIPN